MQHQPNQRQTLEDLLALLEAKQQLIQRKIIRTQVQLELLNHRELLNQTNHIQTTTHNQQTIPVNQSDNNSSSSSEDNNSDRENDQTPNSPNSNSDNDDTSTETNDIDPWRLSDGTIIYYGDSVQILNPANDNEQSGVIIGSTPKRLKIELKNGEVVLRQADNLERDQDSD